MASLKLKLDRTDKKVQSKIRELGGMAHIDNPLQQVVIPIAEEEMDRGEKAVKALRTDHYKDRGDYLSQLPVKQPHRPTLENVAERIQFEKLVKGRQKREKTRAGTKDFPLTTATILTQEGITKSQAKTTSFLNHRRTQPPGYPKFVENLDNSTR